MGYLIENFAEALREFVVAITDGKPARKQEIKLKKALHDLLRFARERGKGEG